MPYFLECIPKVRDLDHNRWSQEVTLDEKHLNSLYVGIINGQGLAVIVEKDNEPIGMCVGIISPNLWAPNTYFLHQVLIYVDEKHNKTKAAYMLIKYYTEQAEKLVNDSRIYKYTFTASEPMFNVDLEKFNYSLVEKTWLSGV
jgi:hypothetical protein